MPVTVATALGVTRGGNGDLTADIITHLRPVQLLLLLDNCEHLSAAVSRLVSALLAGCPALQVLATSRAPLHLREEQLLPVPPLMVPPGNAPLRVMRTVPAAVLFEQRARAVDPRFALTEQNAAAITHLCRRLDGLPLAIELAAARANLLSPSALLALLSHRLQVLGSGPRDAPARHHTLHDAISWSYDLLAPEHQRVFRQLAGFVGGWTLEAAAAVCELPLPDMLACLVALSDQSLIVRQSDADAATPRFTMLETIREFALARLDESDEVDTSRDRHAAYFRNMVIALDMFYAFPGDASWLASIAPEEANFRQALEWFHARGNAHSLSELSSCLVPFWITRSQAVEGLRWLVGAIAGDRDLPAILRAQCRETAGYFLLQLGDLAAAAPFIDEAVALARSCGDQRLLRHTIQTQGNLATAQRDFARAIALHIECEHVARAVAAESPNGDLFIGAQLGLQGLVAHQAGDTATALARITAGLPYLRAPGGRRRLGMLLGELGIIQIMTGHFHEAAPNLPQSVALTWHTGFDRALARTLRGVGAVAAATGQDAAGARLLGAAEAINTRAPFLIARAAPDHDISEWPRSQLAAHLETLDVDRGHDVYAVTCTCLGDRVHLANPAIDLDTHITDVVNTIEFADLHDVHLVGHSYSGMVVTGVAEAIPERLAQVIYLDADVPSDGQNDWQAALYSDEAIVTDMMSGNAAGLPGFFTVDPYVEWIESMTDPANAEWILSKAAPQSLATLIQPLKVGNADATALSRAFIFCTEAALESSTKTAERVRADPNWRVIEMDNNHLVNVNDPQGTAEALMSLL